MAEDAPQIKTTFTADASGFAAASKQASDSVERFARNAKGASEAHEKFSAEALTSRKAIGVFSEATGASREKLELLAHTFEILPPEIAIVVAALMMAKSAFEEETEAIKAATEANNKFNESMKRIRQEEYGEKDDELDKRLQQLGEQEKKLRDERMAREGNKNVQTYVDMLKTPLTGMIGYVFDYLGVAGNEKDKTKYNKDRIDEIKAEENRLKNQSAQMRRDNAVNEARKELMTTGHEGGSGAQQLVTIAQLGVQQAEHSQTDEQIALLKQIAENTTNLPTSNPKPSTGSY